MIITTKNVRNSAQRDYDLISVPGRNGDILIDNKRYANVDVTYTGVITSKTGDMAGITQRLKAWLQTDVNYNKLSDTYHVGYFRQAVIDKIVIKETNSYLATVTITFNCKPFMYSTAGQSVTTLTTAGSITNPMAFGSEPLIRITGNGNITLSVNSNSYVLTGVVGYIDIDSQMLNAFNGLELQNNKMQGYDFPIFKSGVNNISWTGTVTKIEITPRWRCL